jgi:hypothetical protein
VEITKTSFRKVNKNGTVFGAKLRDAIEVYEKRNWPTPQSFDAVNFVRTPEQLAKTRAEKKAGCMNLREQVHYPEMNCSRKNWPTPIARDWGGTTIKPRKDGKSRLDSLPNLTLYLSPQDQEKSNTDGNPHELQGKLNPRWVETLMGLPLGWTCPDCPDSVIRSWKRFVNGWRKAQTEQMKYEAVETE